ncbi:Dihydrofolate reductase [Phycisphaerae bacterium RAS2]|nr:Dihydrofolate reductase [Phycisphaerae bacterium RAS2]
MKVILIVAMTPQGLIGRGGSLPWHDPADLAHFKRTTAGHAVLMGRKTFESIGKPLAKRHNIVLTRDTAWSAAQLKRFGDSANAATASRRAPDDPIPAAAHGTFETADSLEAAVESCRRRGEDAVFVIGGAQVYAAALPRADELIVTWMHRPEAEGDTYFPEWNKADWTATPVANDAGLDIVRYARRV